MLKHFFFGFNKDSFKRKCSKKFKHLFTLIFGAPLFNFLMQEKIEIYILIYYIGCQSKCVRVQSILSWQFFTLKIKRWNWKTVWKMLKYVVAFSLMNCTTYLQVQKGFVWIHFDIHGPKLLGKHAKRRYFFQWIDS